MIKIELKSLFLTLALSVIGMILLIIFIDMLAAPLIGELNSVQVSWCGFFAQCASKTQQTLSEFVMSGGLWSDIDGMRILFRIKKAAGFGVFLGLLFYFLLMRKR